MTIFEFISWDGWKVISTFCNLLILVCLGKLGNEILSLMRRMTKLEMNEINKRVTDDHLD